MVDTIDRIWKNMGMDQNLLSQLHTFKVSGFDRCPKPKSPGGLVSTRFLSGYGSNLGPNAITKLHVLNCQLSILGGDNFAHTHSSIGLDYLGILGAKNTIAKGSIFLGTNSNSTNFGVGIFYLFGRFWRAEIRMPEPNTPA